MAIKCISKNCSFADTNPDNCHFIDCCDFAVEQPTNADRIRAMRDEELAAWMAECNAYREYANASQWLQWLQQPAEEEQI